MQEALRAEAYLQYRFKVEETGIRALAGLLRETSHLLLQLAWKSRTSMMLPRPMERVTLLA